MKLIEQARIVENVAESNYFLFTNPRRTRKDQIEPAVLTRTLTDLNFMDSGARGIPLVVRHSEQVTLEKNGGAVSGLIYQKVLRSTSIRSRQIITPSFFTRWRFFMRNLTGVTIFQV